MRRSMPIVAVAAVLGLIVLGAVLAATTPPEVATPAPTPTPAATTPATPTPAPTPTPAATTPPEVAAVAEQALLLESAVYAFLSLAAEPTGSADWQRQIAGAADQVLRISYQTRESAIGDAAGAYERMIMAYQVGDIDATAEQALQGHAALARWRAAAGLTPDRRPPAPQP